VLCWEVPLVKLMHDSMIVKMGFQSIWQIFSLAENTRVIFSTGWKEEDHT
jgi:hypothetical protein